MAMVELYLLGTPRVAVDGAPRHLPYQGVAALLAYLAVTARPYSRESLATLLWGEVDDQRARHSLRNALYIIRRELRPASPLVAEDSEISLDAEQVWLDVDCFRRDIRQRRTVASLTNALALWRGPFLDGLYVKGAPDFDDWVSRMREQLERLHQEGWLALSQAHELAGRWSEALDAGRHALALNPLNESSHRHVMRLYLQMGNRSGALQQYERYRAMLAEELGVEPDAHTRALYHQILVDSPPARFLSIAHRAVPQREETAQTVFVDRQREMTALDHHLEEAINTKRGRLVLIEGEAGVGKTRLVNEWLAVPRGAHVLVGRCFKAEHSVPYHPWIDLLCNSLSCIDWERLELPNLWLAELARLIPELGVVCSVLPLSAPLDPELSRGRLAEAMHQWLRALSHQRLVCLFLDDLQWIDRASLALLEYLLRHSTGLPLMMLGAQREREADPHWQEIEGILIREGLCHRMALYRLSFPEVDAIARNIGFRAADPDAFLKRLFRETEGNPLFVIEILHSLQNMNVDSSGEWPIPTTIKGVIQSGLGRLSRQTRQMLVVAAVIGRAFDYRILHTITGQPIEAVLSALDEGIAAGIIVEQADHYDFAHGKIRAVLYSTTSCARRQYLHHRIARAVEKLHAGDLSSFFGFLANHFEAAGEAEPACYYVLRAAKRAVELYADEDALSWYDRAQALSERTHAELAPEVIPKVIPFQQVRVSPSLSLDVFGLVHRQRGLIHQRTGRYKMARQDFEFAQVRAIERFRLDEQAAAHGLLSYLAYFCGDYDVLADHAQQSLELATRAGEAALCAEGLRNLGIAAYRTGDYQRAIHLYKEALAAYRSAGDRAGMARCYNNIGFALRTLEQFDEAVESFQQALKLNEEAGFIEGAALVLSNIGRVYARSGDLQQALSCLKRALTLSDETHADWIVAKVCRTMGSVYLRDRRWAQALTYAKRARDLAEMLGSAEDLGATYRLLGEVAAAWPEESGLGAPNSYFEQSIALPREVGEQHELTRTLTSFEEYQRVRG